ncbi:MULTISPECIES: methyltransferase domain-containing protein [unclassified Yoonia]|uniref:methyltransferase domain-containing protein n=1 Tax=unclassified Yoonia TaxID=2629118 RepID=UPI002B000BFA|nr:MULTISPECIES: methyltransferase domain-containing protein [unclassified Yoonia]
MTSWLHEDRLQAVLAAISASGARRVLDLGCGDGDLFVRLAAMPALDDLVGIDICKASLDRLRARLARMDVTAGKVDVRHGSMTDPASDLAGYDCAVLLETIEHIDPDQLSRLERALFTVLRARTVIITTPNAEFNTLLGVPAHRMRHPDHRFEWDRARFRTWCARAAKAAGYTPAFHDIAGAHPTLGGASQMAVFTRPAT